MHFKYSFEEMMIWFDREKENPKYFVNDQHLLPLFSIMGHLKIIPK